MPVKEIAAAKAVPIESENNNRPKRRRLGAFWKFVIVYAVVIAALNVTAYFSEAFSNFYVDNIFRIAASTTGRFSGLFPFSLGEVLPALDPNEFFQLSRSVVASVNAIVRVSKFFKGRLHVTLKAGTTQRSEIVSAARRQDFLNWLGQR